MITAIVPYMAIMPYIVQLEEYKKSVAKQTAEHEIIIQQQKVEQFINLPKLCNAAAKKAKGDIIFYNGADFLFSDPKFFENIERKMKEDNLDMIFPQFFSSGLQDYMVADAPVITREALRRFGNFDETNLGISGVFFTMILWGLHHAKWHSSRDFTVELNANPFIKRVGKRHPPTVKKLLPVIKKVLLELQCHGLSKKGNMKWYRNCYEGRRILVNATTAPKRRYHSIPIKGSTVRSTMVPRHRTGG